MDHTSENKLAWREESDIHCYGVHHFYLKHKPWIKTVFGALLQFIHIGFLYNFGLFFDELQQEFDSSVALTGLVGSISFCLFSFGTILSTWSLRHVSYRKVGVIGVLLGSLSLFVCSFSPTIVYVITLYGVFFGMSSNISMITTFELAVVLFQDKRRARAMTLVALGATVGNLSMSNLIEYILEQIGWRWTFRTFAGILLIVGIGCCTFFSAPDEQRVEEVVDKKAKKAPNSRLICFPEVWLFSLATLSCAVAMVFQYVNMANFLESIGLSDQKSATGITLLAFGDAFAKVLFIVVAPCISFPLTYCLPVCFLVLSILSIALTQTKNTFAIFLITVCCGISRGVFNGLQLPTGLEVFGASRSKTSATVVLTCSGIGNLAGPFIHGSLYDVTASYYPAIYLCAALYLVSSITMLLTPLWQKFFAPNRYMVDYRCQPDARDCQNQSAECVFYIHSSRNNTDGDSFGENNGKDNAAYKDEHESRVESTKL